MARMRAAAIAGLALVIGTSCARSPSQSGIPILRIVANDSSFVMPARVPSGITEVRLVNQGTTTHEGVFVHLLTPTATAAELVDSVRAGIDVPTFEQDAGGPGLARPGDSSHVWMDLVPGRYAVTCWYAGHLSHGQAKEFEIVPFASHARPPDADLQVRMLDFTYVRSGSWNAGHHRVQVENAGKETHEFDPYRLEPGRTPEDWFRWIETGRKGPPPAVPLGGSGTFPPGGREWLELDLTPGHYFAFCQMPARSDGRPHYRHGMVQEFTVP